MSQAPTTGGSNDKVNEKIKDIQTKANASLLKLKQIESMLQNTPETTKTTVDDPSIQFTKTNQDKNNNSSHANGRDFHISTIDAADVTTTSTNSNKTSNQNFQPIPSASQTPVSPRSRSSTGLVTPHQPTPQQQQPRKHQPNDKVTVITSRHKTKFDAKTKIVVTPRSQTISGGQAPFPSSPASPSSTNSTNTSPMSSSAPPNISTPGSDNERSPFSNSTLPKGLVQIRRRLASGEYEGEYEEGIGRHGVGSFIDADNGNKYSGQWKNDKQSGYGTMIYHAAGNWSGNSLNPNASENSVPGVIGEKFQGEWADGRREGNGTMLWGNSDYYLGEWVNSRRETLTGTLRFAGATVITNSEKNNQKTLTTYPPKREYCSQWIEDLPMLCGVMRSIGGTTTEWEYEGQVVSISIDEFNLFDCTTGNFVTNSDGGGSGGSGMSSPIDGGTEKSSELIRFENRPYRMIRQGKGKCVWKTGPNAGGEYYGRWKRDKREGWGVFVTKSKGAKGGVRYYGKWKDDKRDGEGVLFYDMMTANGVEVNTKWDKDRKTGNGGIYCSGGAIIGDWKGDKIEGTFYDEVSMAMKLSTLKTVRAGKWEALIESWLKQKTTGGGLAHKWVVGDMEVIGLVEEFVEYLKWNYKSLIEWVRIGKRKGSRTEGMGGTAAVRESGYGHFFYDKVGREKTLEKSFGCLVDEMNSFYRDVVDSLPDKGECEITGTSRLIGNSNSYNSTDAAVPRKWKHAVSRELMDKTWDKNIYLREMYNKFNRNDDCEFQHKMYQMVSVHHMSLEDLGVKDIFLTGKTSKDEQGVQYDNVIEIMRELSTVEPWQKVDVLMRVSRGVLKAIEDYQVNAFQDDENLKRRSVEALGAEDKFPIFEYILSRSMCDHVCSNLRFIKDFFLFQEFSNVVSKEIMMANSLNGSSSHNNMSGSSNDFMSDMDYRRGSVSEKLQGEYRVAELEAAIVHLKSLHHRVRDSSNVLIPTEILVKNLTSSLQSLFSSLKTPSNNNNNNNNNNLSNSNMFSQKINMVNYGSHNKEEEMEDVWRQRNVKQVEWLVGMIGRVEEEGGIGKGVVENWREGWREGREAEEEEWRKRRAWIGEGMGVVGAKVEWESVKDGRSRRGGRRVKWRAVVSVEEKKRVPECVYREVIGGLLKLKADLKYLN